MHFDWPRIVRHADWRAALACLLLWVAACAGPVGSLASPVSEAPLGSTRVALSGARGQSWGDRPMLSRQTQHPAFVGANVDFAQGERKTWGFGAGALLLRRPEATTLVSPVLSYRGEAPMASGITLFVVIQASTIDVDKNADWNLLAMSRVPVLAPLIGVRQYVPLGKGGLVVSQGAWLAPISVVLPGSLAVDLPLGPLHLLPEFRWDLMARAFRDIDLGATLSGYLSVVLQL